MAQYIEYTKTLSIPITSGLLFGGLTSVYDTSTLTFDKNLALDVSIQGMSSFLATSYGSIIKDMLPQSLSSIEQLTTPLTVGLVNVASTYAIDKLVAGEVFDMKGAIRRFLTSVGSQVVVEKTLGGALNLIPVGQLPSSGPQVTIGRVA